MYLIKIILNGMTNIFRVNVKYSHRLAPKVKKCLREVTQPHEILKLIQLNQYFTLTLVLQKRDKIGVSG